MKKTLPPKSIAPEATSVGLVAAGAAAAVGYYFYGSDQAKKHRTNARRWANTVRKEITTELATRMQSPPDTTVIKNSLKDLHATIKRVTQ